MLRASSWRMIEADALFSKKSEDSGKARFSVRKASRGMQCDITRFNSHREMVALFSKRSEVLVGECYVIQ